MEELNEKEAKVELEKGYEKAEKLLKDEDKMERFLQRLEKKLKEVPIGGEVLSMLPVMVMLVKSYINKEYTDIPIGTIIAVISALIYFLSVIDVIPDSIPGVGYLDDAAVIAFCIKMVHSDIVDYQNWRKENKKDGLDNEKNI